MMNKKIIKYEILCNTPSSLVSEVNKLIRAGWRPWGAPFKSNNPGSNFIYQTLVLYERDQNEPTDS